MSMVRCASMLLLLSTDVATVAIVDDSSEQEIDRVYIWSDLIATALRKEFLKVKNIAHLNSRKSLAIAKRTKKILHRQKAKMGGLIKQNITKEKMLWIKDHMVPDVCPYTTELTARLLKMYIARNDEEMDQIVLKRFVGTKRGRQHASREDILRMAREREQEEYDTCGIEIPDILNATQCQMLREWNGELRYLTNFKFRRFGKRHLEETLQKARNPSVEDKLENTENSLSNSVDATEDNPLTKCAMEGREDGYRERAHNGVRDVAARVKERAWSIELVQFSLPYATGSRVSLVPFSPATSCNFAARERHAPPRDAKGERERERNKWEEKKKKDPEKRGGSMEGSNFSGGISATEFENRSSRRASEPTSTRILEETMQTSRGEESPLVNVGPRVATYNANLPPCQAVPLSYSFFQEPCPFQRSVHSVQPGQQVDHLIGRREARLTLTGAFREAES
ncbi:Translation machinery-associated protein 16 [Eufriesea mexicana]|nr:Translation machinery-associated protein 16 [Eufriesea mexicana]